MPEEGVRIPGVTALLRFVTEGFVTGGFVTMGELRGERGRADGDVLGAVRSGRVPDPLPRAGHDRLAGADLDRAAGVLDNDGAGEHEGDLVELGRLPGLGPPAGGGHPRHAEGGAGGGHPRPTYSSMTLPPGTGMRAGSGMTSGTADTVRPARRQGRRAARRAPRPVPWSRPGRAAIV